jgi:omega-6 fatty acid desaturase (delta-12 desaturase)
VILFGLGPLYLLAKQRWLAVGITAPGSEAERKQKQSVYATNATILAAAVAVSMVIGVKALALVYLPVILLAASAGIWLFYVQHQFEDTYWEPHEEWEYDTAALHGSSYYKLPRVLEWMTGSIGLHHVHHTDPRIPNYNLRQCHEENAAFHRVTQLSLRDSFRTASLKLWDAEKGCMVGFDAVEGKGRERR